MTLKSTECDFVSNVSRGGMQNPALVLCNDEGGDAITELEDLSCVSEEGYCGPTAINIENSKDVIVGPVTQFNGPVTIYHNANGISRENGASNENKTITQNGKLVKSESTSSDSSPGGEKSNTNSLLHSRRLKYIGIAVVITIIVVVILCATLLPGNKTEEQITPTIYEKINHSQDYNEGQLQPASGLLIPREGWKGMNTICNNTLKHPTPLVIICHTATPLCKSFSKCADRVKNIQAGHVNSRQFCDISYNFLIGGDGNAYVGRDWDTTNIISDNSISIAFIGNFVQFNLTESMIKAAIALIGVGVETEKLSKNYKVVGHSQTVATESPGRHVYEVIKTWDHYDGSDYIGTGTKLLKNRPIERNV